MKTIIKDMYDKTYTHFIKLLITEITTQNTNHNTRVN